LHEKDDYPNATVTRFVRRLGYATYENARKHVRSEKNAGSPLLLRVLVCNQSNARRSQLCKYRAPRTICDSV